MLSPYLGAAHWLWCALVLLSLVEWALGRSKNPRARSVAAASALGVRRLLMVVRVGAVPVVGPILLGVFGALAGRGVNETASFSLGNAALVGLLIAAVGYLVRLTVWDAIKELRSTAKDFEKRLTAVEGKASGSSDSIKELRESAKSQGKRIGDLESFQYAVELGAKVERRVRRELGDTRGVPTPRDEKDES